MNPNDRLRKIEGALLSGLQVKEPPNKYIGPPGGLMRLPIDATETQIRVCRQVATMDAIVPAGPLE
jgi:hypothetical protein